MARLIELLRCAEISVCTGFVRKDQYLHDQRLLHAHPFNKALAWIHLLVQSLNWELTHYHVFLSIAVINESTNNSWSETICALSRVFSHDLCRINESKLKDEWMNQSMIINQWLSVNQATWIFQWKNCIILSSWRLSFPTILDIFFHCVGIHSTFELILIQRLFRSKTIYMMYMIVWYRIHLFTLQL